MRQIFDVNRQRQENQDVIYPALPNVSRQLLPREKRLVTDSPTSHYRYHCTRQSPHLNQAVVQDNPTSSQATANNDQASSETWSDDSGYLVSDGECVSTTTSFVALSDGKVNYWLSAPYDNTFESNEENMSEHTAQSDYLPGLRQPVTPDKTIFGEDVPSNTANMNPRRSMLGTQAHRHASDTYKRIELASLDVQQAGQTLKLIDTSMQLGAEQLKTTHHRQASTPACRDPGLGEPQLSPLSSNVCVERGPSRYNASGRAHVTIDTSANTSRLLGRFHQRRFQENLSPRSPDDLKNQVSRQDQQLLLSTDY